MKSRFILFWLVLLAVAGNSQNNCETGFVQDTLYLPMEKKTLPGEYLQATLKNKSVVQLYKLKGNKYYLKLIVTENLYFDKVDQLEIQSGSKSFYAKDTQQYELDKATGYYVVEIYKNYIGTLKDDGLSAIVFGSATTSFTRQDGSQVKQIAKCFYETIASKK